MLPVAGERFVELSPTNAGQSRAVRFSLLALVALGTGLRLWQYFANTAIWLDEVAVARNLLIVPSGDF